MVTNRESVPQWEIRPGNVGYDSNWFQNSHTYTPTEIERVVCREYSETIRIRRLKALTSMTARTYKTRKCDVTTVAKSQATTRVILHKGSASAVRSPETRLAELGPVIKLVICKGIAAK